MDGPISQNFDKSSLSKTLFPLPPKWPLPDSGVHTTLRVSKFFPTGGDGEESPC